MNTKPPIVLHILFSIYAWVVTFIILLYLSLTSILFTALAGYQKSYRYMAFIFSSVFYFLFCRIRIQCHPLYDPKESYVMVQNHVNLLDGFIAPRFCKRPIVGLMHRWQFQIPFYGWLMRLSMGIEVDPTKKTNLEYMVEQAIHRKKKNCSIITFPEGGRTLNGKCKPFKKGVFMMAQKADYPIVPICVRGMYQINQKGSYKVWPHPIDVYVGKPRSLDGLDKKELEQTIQEVRNEICAFVEENQLPDEFIHKP